MGGLIALSVGDSNSGIGPFGRGHVESPWCLLGDMVKECPIFDSPRASWRWHLHMAENPMLTLDTWPLTTSNPSGVVRSPHTRDDGRLNPGGRGSKFESVGVYEFISSSDC